MVFRVIEKFVKLCKKNIISELKKIDLKLTSTRHCKMMETVDWLRCHEMNTNRHPLLACHAYAWGTRKSTQYVQIYYPCTHISPHTPQTYIHIPYTYYIHPPIYIYVYHRHKYHTHIKNTKKKCLFFLWPFSAVARDEQKSSKEKIKS